MIRANSVALLVYTMAAAFAFTLPAHLPPRSTIITSISSKWNPGPKPAISGRSNRFTYNGESSIGAGHSAMVTKRRPEGGKASITNTPRGRFTYEGESNIGGGISAIINRKPRVSSMAEPVQRKELTEEGAQQVVTDKAKARTELSARSKLLDECQALQNEAVEADKYACSLSLELEEATWACDKAKGKLEATLDKVKEAESEISVRSKSLGECEALLNKAVEAAAYVSWLSHKLEEATLAHDTATLRLEATLEKAAV